MRACIQQVLSPADLASTAAAKAEEAGTPPEEILEIAEEEENELAGSRDRAAAVHAELERERKAVLEAVARARAAEIPVEEGFINHALEAIATERAAVGMPGLLTQPPPHTHTYTSTYTHHTYTCPTA